MDKIHECMNSVIFPIGKEHSILVQLMELYGCEQKYVRKGNECVSYITIIHHLFDLPVKGNQIYKFMRNELRNGSTNL
jgi:hypothetical protein